MKENEIKLLIGNRIKQLREFRGLTQEQFCDKINLEQPNLSNIENGKSFPSFITFLSILEVLEVKPNDIIDFMEDYQGIDLDNKANVEIVRYLTNLPEKTKKVICEIIKN